MAFTAKSVIFDIADNYGNTSLLGVRRLEFKFDGTLFALTSSDYTAYATSQYNTSYLPRFAFDTTLSKTGAATGLAWVAGSGHVTNRRLIIVFNSPITFDEIVVNNYHTSGGSTNVGLENVKINISTDAITSTVYDSAISNSTLIFDSTFPQHPATNTIDDQSITLINPPDDVSVTETVTLTDSHILNAEIINESVTLSDSHSVISTTNLTQNEAVTLTDSHVISGVESGLSETVTISDIHEASFPIETPETATLSDSHSVNLLRVETITESVTLSDSHDVLEPVASAETVILSDEVFINQLTHLTEQETATLTDSHFPNRIVTSVDFPPADSSTGTAGTFTGYQYTGYTAFAGILGYDIWLNGTSCAYCVSSFDINFEAGNYCFDFNANFTNKELFTACLNQLESGNLAITILISIDSSIQQYDFLIEKITENGDFFSIWGRSTQAYLSEMYSKPIIDNEINKHPWMTGKILFSELITFVIENYCPYPVVINYNIPDYTVRRGTLQLNDVSPIQAIQTLCEAAGAELYPKPDGSLSIDALVITGSTAASYDGKIEIINCNIEKLANPRYDSVLVLGKDNIPEETEEGEPISTQAALKIEMHPDQVGIETGLNELHKVRIFYYHSDTDNPNDIHLIFYSTASGFSSHVNTLFQGINTPVVITETVNLTWGQGNSAYADLNGNTLVDRPEYYTTPFNSISYSYQTNAIDGYLQANQLGNIPVSCYFQDGSAETSYSFTITEDVTTYAYQTFRLKKAYSLVPLSGVSVYINDVLQGVTDENGYITSMERLIVGQTYNFKALKTGSNLIPTDEDYLENDDFVAVAES